LKNTFFCCSKKFLHLQLNLFQSTIILKAQKYKVILIKAAAI